MNKIAGAEYRVCRILQLSLTKYANETAHKYPDVSKNQQRIPASVLFEGPVIEINDICIHVILIPPKGKTANMTNKFSDTELKTNELS